MVFFKINLKYVSKLFKNTFWLGIAEVSQKASIFISIIFFSRYFSVEEFGTMTYAIGFVGIFASLSDMSLSIIGVRDMVRMNEKEQYWNRLFSLRLLMVPIAFLGWIALIGLNHATQHILFFASFSLIYTLFSFLAEFVVIRFRAEEKMYFETIIKAISGFLRIGAVSLCSINHAGILITFALFSMVSPVSLILGIFLLKNINSRLRWVWDTGFFKQRLSESAPLALAFLMVFYFSKIDQIIVFNLLGEGPSGLYQVCVNFVYMIATITIIVLNAVFPLLSRKMSKQNFNKKISFILAIIFFVIGCMISIAMLFFGKTAITMLYGLKYLAAFSILKWYVFLLPTLMGLSFLNYYFIAVGGQKKCLYIYGLTCILTPGVFAGVKMYGAAGAAFSVSCINLIAFCYGIYFLLTTYNKSCPNRPNRNDEESYFEPLAG